MSEIKTKKKTSSKNPDMFEVLIHDFETYRLKHKTRSLDVDEIKDTIYKIKSLFSGSVSVQIYRRINICTKEVFGNVKVCLEFNDLQDNSGNFLASQWVLENKIKLLHLYLETSYLYIKKAWEVKHNIEKIFYPISTESIIREGHSYKHHFLLSLYGIAEIVKKYSHPNDNDSFLRIFLQNKSDEISLWDIQFNFTGKSHKSLNSIYLLIEYINLIVPESTKLIKIQSGSILASIKTYFTSKKAEQDVEEALGDVKKYVTAKLTKDSEEIQKVKKEQDKLEIDIRLKEKELEDANSFNAKYNKSLTTRKAELEIEWLELDNEKQRIENFKRKKDLLKELLADSLIEQNEYELIIKGQTFMSYSDKHGLSNKEIDISELDRKERGNSKNNDN